MFVANNKQNKLSEQAKLLYNAKKHKLVLWIDDKVAWHYKFKARKISNIERIFAYIMAHPRQVTKNSASAVNHHKSRVL